MQYLYRKPTHPGGLLADFLEALKMSQSQLAKHLGGSWTQPKLNAIIHGKRGITPETALALSDAFGNTPEFWLNAQNACDLWEARQKHQKIKALKMVS